MEITEAVASFPNGLKLKLVPEQISKQAVWDATRRFPDPEPPRVYIASTGAYEENPDDPDYRAGLERQKERRAFESVKVMIVMGSEMVEPPEGLPDQNGIDWRKFAFVRDHPVPENQYERYDLWLRYYAFGHRMAPADGLKEFIALTEYLAVASGLTMEGPSSVVATFRNNQGRGAAEPGDAVEAAGDGDASGAVPAGGTGY